jgi:hypothetical protein
MSQPIFVFKVALVGRKSVWRKIALRGNQTLDDLHEAIFDAFDRDDEHLYSFYFPRPGKKFSRRTIREAVEYQCPFDEMEDPSRNAAKTRLASLPLKPKTVFYYLFDFGDEWWHEITVEEADAKEEPGHYPRMVDSRGKSPPQYPGDEDEEDDEEG